MTFIKIGETIQINKENLKSYQEIASDSFIANKFTKIASLKTKEEDFTYFTSFLMQLAKEKTQTLNKTAFVQEPLSEVEITEKFSKFAKELKVIAPKANDFLYFTAIMMHAAEASLLDDKGQIRKHADGTPITVKWEKKSTPKGESWSWKCSDVSIKPYKNKNGDIFPHDELKLAYKNWVGKPLCRDHQSSSVDHILGVIVDTYYDEPNYRIIALCALDRKNYPDLARKVEAGYSTCVSMGTAVATAICYDCGAVAKAEADFCGCMKNKLCYGEINVGLNPIELSLVVNGADPQAKIRQIVASAENLEKYVSQEEFLNSQASQELVKSKLEAMMNEIGILKSQDQITNHFTNVLGKLAHQVEDLSQKVSYLINQRTQMANKQAYFQGTEEPTPGKPQYPKEEGDKFREQDHHLTGQSPFPGTGPLDGMHPGYESFGESEEERKRRLKRLAEEQEQRRIRRQSALNKIKESMKKNSYYQGTEEPTPGKSKYPKEEGDKLRAQDHHMVGQSPFPGVGNIEGLHPSPESVDIKDELKRKEMLHRADEKLSAKFFRESTADGRIEPKKTRWEIKAGDKLLVNATLWDVYGDKYSFHYDQFASKPFAKNLIAKIRAEGSELVNLQLKKSAQAAPGMPAAPAMPEASMETPQAMGNLGMPEAPSGDEGGSGDPKEEISKSLDEMEGLFGELRKNFEVLTGSDTTKEMSGFQDLVNSGAMPPEQTKALAFEKKTREYLVKGFQESGRKVADIIDDLSFAKEALDRPEFKTMTAKDRREFFGLIRESLEDSKLIKNECQLLAKALVKYARGREFMIRRASMMKQQIKKAQDPTQGVPGRVYQAGDPFMPLDATPGVPYQPSTGSTAPVTTPKEKQVRKTAPPKPGIGPQKIDDKLPLPYGERKNLTNMLEGATQAISGQSFSGPAQKTPKPMDASVSADAGKPDAKAPGAKADDGMASDSNDLKMDSDGKLEGTPEEVGKAMKAKEAAMDLSTKEARAAVRSKLAAQTVQFSDMLKNHKGGTTVKFEVKPSGDLAKVETLEEVNKAMMDVANAPPQVRKKAEEISRLVSLGKINPEVDFPGLIANGLDAKAVALYNNYLKNKDAKEAVASELAKEKELQKLAQAEEKIKVKAQRAYELALAMSKRGICGASEEEINAQAKTLIDFEDKSFEEVKSQVMRVPVKTAAVNGMPNIGAMQSFVESTIPMGTTQEDLTAQFAAAFSSGKRKGRY